MEHGVVYLHRHLCSLTQLVFSRKFSFLFCGQINYGYAKQAFKFGVTMLTLFRAVTLYVQGYLITTFRLFF